MFKQFSYTALLIVTTSVLCNANPVLEKEYKIEAFRKDGDAQILVLRIHENDAIPSKYRQGRQEFATDEDEEEEETTRAATGPSTTPHIPAVVPALTKIFTGLLTGNINDIVHGSSSFAPQNISHTFDTVYNAVVGLAPPVSTQAPTRTPQVTLGTESPIEPPASTVASPPAVSAPISSVSSSSASVSSDITSQTSTLGSTTTTVKPVSNEDDEDDYELGFKRNLKRRDGTKERRT